MLSKWFALRKQSAKALLSRPAEAVIRFDTPVGDGRLYRFNHGPMPLADARSFAMRQRRGYALGTASSYPIAIIRFRIKGERGDG